MFRKCKQRFAKTVHVFKEGADLALCGVVLTRGVYIVKPDNEEVTCEKCRAALNGILSEKLVSA